MKVLFRGVFAAAAFILGASCAQALPLCAPMDFDGDCKSDILWRHGPSGQDYLWLMNGLTIASQGYLTTIDDPAWIIAGIGDFDGDGKADILWRNTLTGENYLWLMNGLTVAARGQVNVIDDPAWQIQGVADFDGDGRADILWRNTSTGENYMYLMNGWTIVARGLVNVVDDQNWQIKGVGDFDGDGRADILWRNASTGENYMYLMNGWTIVGRGLVNVVDDLNWQIKGIGDFDGDGKADILWRNYATGDNYMYLMNGSTIAARGLVNNIDPGDGWDIRAIGDFDGDGKADIWWRHNATGQDYIYFMNGWTMASRGFAVTAPDVGWMPRSALTVADGAGPDTSAPSAPTALSASAASTSKINLSWNAASDNVGVIRYRVYRNGVALADVPQTWLSDTGLAAATTYSYAVAAYDAARNLSAPSNSASATTKAPADTQAPSTPLNLSGAVISSSQIDVSWAASTDNVGVAGYRVYRDGVLAATPRGTVVSIVGLAAGTTYSFAVCAFDAAGNVSVLSPALAVSIPPADTTAPTVPTGLAASGLAASALAGTSLTLSWTASTDNVGVTGYRVYRDGMLIASPVVATVPVTGLAAGMTYAFTVAAFDAAGNVSAPSPALSVSMPVADTIAPSVPVDLAVSALASTSLTLSWSASTDNVGVTGYRVFQNGVLVASPAATSVAISGLAAATSYSFTVAAVDVAGNVSAPSPALPITTPAAAQVLWRADMESGDLGEWSEKVNSGSADSWAVLAASEGIPAKRGQWVMKQSVTGTAGGTRMSRYPEIDSLTQSGTTFYVSWWEYYPTRLTASGSPSNFMFSNFQVLSQDNCATCWNPIWGLYINPADFTTTLVWSPNDMAPAQGPHAGESGKRAYYATQVVPVGQWVLFEAMIKPAADFSGALKLWMNGVVLFDLANVKTRFPDVGVGGRQWTAIDAYGSYISPIPATHYVDDVTISLGRLYAQ